MVHSGADHKYCINSRVSSRVSLVLTIVVYIGATICVRLFSWRSGILMYCIGAAAVRSSMKSVVQNMLVDSRQTVFYYIPQIEG